jgi:hypothetical protein
VFNTVINEHTIKCTSAPIRCCAHAQHHVAHHAMCCHCVNVIVRVTLVVVDIGRVDERRRRWRDRTQRSQLHARTHVDDDDTQHNHTPGRVMRVRYAVRSPTRSQRRQRRARLSPPTASAATRRRTSAAVAAHGRVRTYRRVVRRRSRSDTRTRKARLSPCACVARVVHTRQTMVAASARSLAPRLQLSRHRQTQTASQTASTRAKRAVKR